jgi:predicted DsbA family dithiol-disulfide isomerase
MEHLSAKYGAAAVARFGQPGNPLDKAGEAVGIKFNPARRVIRTLEAHRLYEWSKHVEGASEKLSDQFMEVMFKAYFEDAKDLSQKSELLACVAATPGLSVDDATTFLATNNLSDDTYTNAISWSSKGVNGVPFFIVDKVGSNKKPISFSGAHPPETFLEVLEEVGNY